MQVVVVKVPQPLDPGNSKSDVLWQESNMLQQLAGISGVPRVLDQGWDATKQNTAIIMQPLGVVLQWKVWSSSTRKTPLHTLMAPLVTTLEQSHARSFINRDLRPSNIVLASGSSDKLYIIDWGFAVRCQPGSSSYRGEYSGTIAYASDRVLQQFISLVDNDDVEVVPADDLVSLVRCMFTVLHPDAHQELRSLRRGDAQEVLHFWRRMMATRPAWRAAMRVAALGRYHAVSVTLARLLE